MAAALKVWYKEHYLQNGLGKFSRLLILVEEYSRNKNTIERTIDLREYLV